MCFRNDYDWYPQVVEIEQVVLSKPTRCEECRRKLPTGETMKRTYLQENHPDDWDDEDGNPVDFEPGETSLHYTCLPCCQLLEAVQSAEEDAGCKGDEAMPAVGELGDALYDEPERYLAKLKELYPNFPQEHLDIFLSEE